MDSHDQQVQQQTRLPGFFRNVHSRFSGFGKQGDPKAGESDVVITSQVLRKKPQLVIGNASNRISPPEPFLLPNAGVGTKRRATTEVEDVMNKRIDARMREVSIPTCCRNAFSILNPATKEEEVLVKQVTWEQDSDWRAMNEPAFTVSNPQEESNKFESVAEDVIVQPSHNSGPPCQLKETSVDTEVGKIDNKEGIFGTLAEEIDSENCTTSGNCQRKDELLGGKWSLPVDLKGDVFSCKLKEILAKPFDDQECNEMWALATRRKPVLKLRQTRGRTMQVTTNDEGLSYLDHHPDLFQRLEESSHPSEKLALLRCFFFWLQHSCMEGAYKPWAPASKNSTEEDDCDFTDGPDCEVLAVVLPLDEKKDVSSVAKPVEPVTVDLSDDDEDDCLEVSETLPVQAVPKPNNCNNFQKAATCNFCFKEFGMEKEQQRALYKSCGHIETCMKCVDRLWMVGKQSCLKCGALQSARPRSIMDFADDSD